MGNKLRKDAISLFYSYSHKDEALRQELVTHLSSLRREGLINEWYDHKILAGEDFDHEISAKLEESQIILLLVSSNFINSDYCFSKEMSRALERNKEGDARVIPIILRACDWENTPLKSLKALPRDGEAVTSWRNRDEAWKDTVMGIRNLIQQMNLKAGLESGDNQADEHLEGSFKHLLVNAIDGLEALASSTESDAGESEPPEESDSLFPKRAMTGFVDLDSIINGFQPGELVLVAGRPGSGKSSLITNIAEYFTLKHAEPVLIISLEMNGDLFMKRVMASLGRLGFENVLSGVLLDEDWDRLTAVVGILSESPFYIDDSPFQSVSSIRSTAQQCVHAHGLSLIIIDSLQLLTAPNNIDPETDYAKTMRTLKLLGRELGVPIIVTAQLSGKLETRSNKRPILLDLEELGGIDQVADTIILIYRDEMYDAGSNDKGIAELIVAQNLCGPVGTVRLTYLAKFVRFENFTPDLYMTKVDDAEGSSDVPF